MRGWLIALPLLLAGHGAWAAACQAMSPHGFFGREEEVIAAMAEFITPSAPR